jgi:response regulator RpfG family c-di-GMP phosphodiesterase
MSVNNADYTILLVDDEENILRSLKRQLAELDYGIEIVPSGPQGLELLDEKEIAVIISDQRMPGMSGTQFLSMAKKKQPDTIRMLLTAYSDLKDTVDAINQGEIYKYLSKPWDEGALKRTVSEAVERYALIKENKRLNRELGAWNTQLELRVQEQTRDMQRSNLELLALNEKLENNFQSCLAAFAGLIELCDRKKSNHANMVSELSVRIAEEMGFPQNELPILRAGALLHDIGKIGITEAVLKKDAAGLTFSERKEYEQHPVRGQAAVDAIECLRDAGVLIRHHHEWLSGAGYPDGLGGTDIPLGARIIAVANAIDRHANPGSNEGPYDFTSALAVVELDADSKYDRAVLLAARPVVENIEKYFCCVKDPREQSCSPEELHPGMQLSRFIRTGTGVLFMTAGTELTAENIRKLNRIQEIDPPSQNVFVCQPKE